jgi:hypothetical protein
MKSAIHFIMAIAAALLIAPQTLAVPITIVDTLAGTLEDISGDGVDFSIPTDSSVSFTSIAGNLVLPAGNIVVAENGGIAIGTPPSTSLSPTNATIPSLGAFGNGQAILDYWDDLDSIDPDLLLMATCTGSKNPSYTRAVRPTQTIVRSRRCRRGGSILGTGFDEVETQIQIYANPGPFGILAQIFYIKVGDPIPDGGASATIGYQDGGSGNNDFQWSFDTAGSVADGTILSIVPEPATASLMVGAIMVGLVRTRRPRS